MKKLKIIALAVGFALLAGCGVNDADVVKKNMSTDADNFKINRRIVFYNSITNDYMLVIEGLCSVDIEDRKLTVICKTSEDSYKKHVLGRSDNVTFFVQQIDASKESKFRYLVTFKPASILPDFNLYN